MLVELGLGDAGAEGAWSDDDDAPPCFGVLVPDVAPLCGSSFSIRCVDSLGGVVEGGVAPADSEPEADLPAERVKDANRLRRDEGVVVVVVLVVGVDSLSGVAAVALRVAVQVALRLNGGVTGSDDPDEVDESIEGGMRGRKANATNVLDEWRAVSSEQSPSDNRMRLRGSDICMTSADDVACWTSEWIEKVEGLKQAFRPKQGLLWSM